VFRWLRGGVFDNYLSFGGVLGLIKMPVFTIKDLVEATQTQVKIYSGGKFGICLSDFVSIPHDV
jgi:hypothetical protein